MAAIRVGIIGCGTVGQGVARLLLHRAEAFRRRLGVPLVLGRVAEVDPARIQASGLEPALFTTRARDLLEDPALDIVVEVIGGTEAARELVLAAIERGKQVVTANKALLALYGNELFEAAARAGVEVAFEASVCGGIPIILALRQGLAANRLQELLGILNGTTNYILSRMAEDNLPYDTALAEAQAQGYAEADPSLDVDGVDAAHKLAILMALAYETRIDFEAVSVSGIRGLDPLDLQFAREFGYAVKLLAISRNDGDRLEARVHPTLIPRDHLLAGVSGAMNAVHLIGDAVGPLLLSGAGAGQLPTASAVVSDILEVARNLSLGITRRLPPLGSEAALATRRPVKPLAEVVTNYYFRFAALDRPGVLSQISGVLAKYQISIAAVIQKGREVKGAVPIVMITHEAREADVQQALAEIDRLPVVSPPTVMYRIEDPHLHSARI